MAAEKLLLPMPLPLLLWRCQWGRLNYWRL
jgi:hypothetical protein